LEYEAKLVAVGYFKADSIRIDLIIAAQLVKIILKGTTAFFITNEFVFLKPN
jgi:hypothetical protein